MKLTKAQEEILNYAKKDIDLARSFNTYEEYEYNRNHYWQGRYTLEEARELIKENDLENNKFFSKLYEERKRGNAIVTANTRTIKKLEELGLIEIIDEGGSYPDMIKVIGY